MSDHVGDDSAAAVHAQIEYFLLELAHFVEEADAPLRRIHNEGNVSETLMANFCDFASGLGEGRVFRGDHQRGDMKLGSYLPSFL